MKIRGNTVGTPMAVPDWDQDNPLRANYIKNKPENRLLPVVTEEDNDKLLLVKNGKWVLDDAPDIGGGGGEDGVGIKSVVQTTTSTESEGINVVTVTLTDNTKYTFSVRNGKQGEKGDKGDTGLGFSISKIYSSVSAMNDGYSTDGVPVGGFVLINTNDVDDPDNAKLYVKGNAAYSYLTDLSGAQGIKGEKGDPYTLTDTDKQSIAEEVYSMIADGNGVAY